MTGRLRAAVYCRISADPEGRELGVQRQEEDCRARAEREGWVVVGVFTDNDLSASTRSRKRRPRFEDMLAAVERAEVDVVVAYSNSRLTRRPLELEHLIKLHERTRVRISTVVSGDDDLSTADGRMVARIKASVDAAEAERTAERGARAAKQRAESGQMRGRRCFGYLGDGSLVPAEAEAIREAVESVLAGASLYEVARRWDAAGLQRLHGGSWRPHPTKVKQVLTSARIAAIPVYQGVEMPDVEASWAPIIDRDKLAQVRAVLCDPARRTNNRRPARNSVLSGILRCECGAPMRSSTSQGSRKLDPVRRAVERVPSFMCSAGAGRCLAMIRAEPVEEAVREAVVVELLSRDLAALAPEPADGARMAELRAELADVAEARAAVYSALAARPQDAVAAGAALEGLDGRQHAAEAELEAIGRRFGPALFVSRAAEDLLALSDGDADRRAARVLERFLALDLGIRRAVVDALLQIVVHKGLRRDPAERVEVRSRATGEVFDLSWTAARFVTEMAG